MIESSLTRDIAGRVIAFEVFNHGESHVCAAVSMLVINTVNSIEALTDAEFSCKYDKKNTGYITFELESPRSISPGTEAGLLLDAMVLGLEATAQKHPTELTMKEK
ncbi:MAG: ribosomal-processing cysteine protease Prp [Defluviitaleaceae bacterium]|nr:ribosomal-processing cysteine protease Prp [Defluviitaleaceae bacterium]MCL2276066.1 ribosomal-processing cysteine protease Prp [Defluviitaleaceae bacterium]